MKDLAIYIHPESGGEVILAFRPADNHYTRPLAYLPKLGELLRRLWRTENYQFRPFLTGSFGIVIEKVE